MSFQKYLDSLAMMDEVIAVAATPAVNLAWDNLYTFLHANFISPISAGNTRFTGAKANVQEFAAEVEEMVVMFGKNRATLEEELRKIPPVIAEVAFPVYIACYLLRDYNACVNPSILVTFDEFHQRYGYMIIEGAIKLDKLVD